MTALPAAPRLAFVGMVFAATVLAVACGGGSSELNIPPARADDFAHQALLKEVDLGKEWKIQRDDNFAPEGTASPATACQLPESAAASKELQAKITGRSNRQMALIAPGNSLTVQLDIQVYPDAKTAKAALEIARANVQRPEYLTCIQDVFAKSAQGGAIQVKASEPGIDVRKDGFSLSFVVTSPDAKEGSGLRSDAHVWVNGNVVTGLQAIGAEANVSKKTMLDLVVRLKARLNIAAK